MSNVCSMIIRIFNLTSITALFAQYITTNGKLEDSEQSRLSYSSYLSPQIDYFSMPLKSARWLSVKPFNDNTHFSPYNKRGSSNNENNGAQRDIRSPLGTMRFGKRNVGSPLGTMRFGKREYDGTSQLGNKLSHSMMRFGKRSEPSPLGTMRFGKRESDESFGNSPLGTMRFGKRESDESFGKLGTMRFGKRDIDESFSNSPLGTMRFGKRQFEQLSDRNAPIGTMHFGKKSEDDENSSQDASNFNLPNTNTLLKKRSYGQVQPLQIVERSGSPLGTMRFGK